VKAAAKPVQQVKAAVKPVQQAKAAAKPVQQVKAAAKPVQQAKAVVLSHARIQMKMVPAMMKIIIATSTTSLLRVDERVQIVQGALCPR
jgi:hypothetical protein